MKNFFVLLFLLPMVIACKKEYGSGKDTHTYYDLTAEQLAKTPYFNNPAFDTLQFVSNKGDTLTFAKLATVSSYYKTANSNCPDCPTNYYYFQELKNTYQTIQGEGKFEVTQKRKSSYSNFEFSFNNSTFFLSDDHIGWAGYPTFVGSLTLNNRTFKEMIIIYEVFGDTSSNAAFINEEDGLFYFKDNNNKLNYLINKK